MRVSLQKVDSPTARLCARICAISLAAFVTAGLGLLSYLGNDPGPAWLRMLAGGSGLLALVAFAGWLLTSLGALARDYHHSR